MKKGGPNVCSCFDMFNNNGARRASAGGGVRLKPLTNTIAYENWKTQTVGEGMQPLSRVLLGPAWAFALISINSLVVPFPILCEWCSDCVDVIDICLCWASRLRLVRVKCLHPWRSSGNYVNDKHALEASGPPSPPPLIPVGIIQADNFCAVFAQLCEFPGGGGCDGVTTTNCQLSLTASLLSARTTRCLRP